jgi:hypothetical protein
MRVNPPDVFVDKFGLVPGGLDARRPRDQGRLPASGLRLAGLQLPGFRLRASGFRLADHFNRTSVTRRRDPRKLSAE